jgi:hypothetical protein
VVISPRTTSKDFFDLAVIAERSAAFEARFNRWHVPSTGSSTGTTSTSSWPASMPTRRERLFLSPPEQARSDLSQGSGPDRYRPQAQSRASSGEPAKLPLGSTESS